MFFKSFPRLFSFFVIVGRLWAFVLRLLARYSLVVSQLFSALLTKAMRSMSHLVNKTLQSVEFNYLRDIRRPGPSDSSRR